jgi:hypothetical protein
MSGDATSATAGSRQEIFLRRSSSTRCSAGPFLNYFTGLSPSGPCLRATRPTERDRGGRAGDRPCVVCIELGRMLRNAALQGARVALVHRAQRAILCRSAEVRT